MHAALARVDDPEIRKPITDLGMVKDGDGRAGRRRPMSAVYLTVAGCPMRETITSRVTEAVSAVRGYQRGAGRAGRDERRAAQPSCAAGCAATRPTR